MSSWPLSGSHRATQTRAPQSANVRAPSRPTRSDSVRHAERARTAARSAVGSAPVLCRQSDGLHAPSESGLLVHYGRASWTSIGQRPPPLPGP